MIGNDVVDLTVARKESNWQRRGYLQKIFSADERQLIAAHSHPETMVWVLWSMKEAAYKIYNRQTGIRAFIPHRLICADVLQSGENFTGSVQYGQELYHTRTVIEDNIIATNAVDLKKDLERIKEINNTTIIKDGNGIPYIYDAKNNLQPVSVSHHGRCHKIVTLL